MQERGNAPFFSMFSGMRALEPAMITSRGGRTETCEVTSSEWTV